MTKMATPKSNDTMASRYPLASASIETPIKHNPTKEKRILNLQDTRSSNTSHNRSLELRKFMLLRQWLSSWTRIAPGPPFSQSANPSH